MVRCGAACGADIGGEEAPARKGRALTTGRAVSPRGGGGPVPRRRCGDTLERAPPPTDRQSYNMRRRRGWRGGRRAADLPPVAGAPLKCNYPTPQGCGASQLSGQWARDRPSAAACGCVYLNLILWQYLLRSRTALIRITSRFFRLRTVY